MFLLKYAYIFDLDAYETKFNEIDYEYVQKLDCEYAKHYIANSKTGPKKYQKKNNVRYMKTKAVFYIT